MKQLLSKGKVLVTYLSVFSVLAASILSVFAGVNIGVIAETGAAPNNTVWDGIDSNPINIPYDDGEGSSVDPFIISNGDQLYRMLYEQGAPAGESAFYKLANDIYLNSVDDYNNWKNSGYDFSSLNNWASGISDKDFIGSIDGDGYTIYGMYARGLSAGFIPRIGGATVTVKNLNIDKFYVVATGTGFDGGAAAIVGAGININKNARVVVSNCAITNGTAKGKYATAVFASRYTTPASIKNILVADVVVNGSTEQAGVSAVGWSSSVTASNCVFVGIHPLGTNSQSANFSGSYIYTDTACPDGVSSTTAAKSISVVDESDLIGSEAGKLDLDWDNWKENATGYPTPKKEKILGTGVGYVAENPTDSWNGKSAKSYVAGFGTSDDPWIIETAEQFYLMACSAGTGEYFKVADGVEAFYFNDIQGMNYAQAMEYLAGASALKYAPGDSNAFSGYFDGNGVTIYGISSIGNSEIICAALFPQLGNNATIKNITVKHSYFIAAGTSELGGVGGIAGAIARGGSATIRNSAVIECKISATGQTPAAGIIANTADNTKTTIKNCLVADCDITSAHVDSKFSAIVSGGWSPFTRVIENCLTIGTYPMSGYANSYTSKNNTYIGVYTDSTAPTTAAEASLSKYITSINADDVKGDSAKTTLSGFDWETQWKTGAKYPTPRKFAANNGGIGKVWSGATADSFAGGVGSENDPYQIDTPERLRYMLDHTAEGTYYALTADIYLNDVTADNWYESNDVNSWVTSNDVSTFLGRLNGLNHTIYGLYGDNISSGVSAGLIPVMGASAWVRNLTVDKAYISGAAGSNIGTIAGSAESYASKPMNLRGCEIKENVILNGGGNVGGVIGYIGLSAFQMDNIAFKGQIKGSCKASGGINAVSDGAATIKSSFSVGIQALGDADGYAISDVYSNVEGVNSKITILTDDEMKGANAQTYMSALAWADNAWKTVDNDYPVLVGTIKPANGVAGDIWSGEKAVDYAGGDGTPENPYQIATGEQLYKLYMEDLGKANHYILTADILLNDVNGDFWASKIGLNTWTGSTAAFKGNFDGAGHVIVGLYFNEPEASVSYVGLFPEITDGAVIKRVGLSYAYLAQKDEGDGNYFTGGIVALVSNWDGNEYIPKEEFADGEVNGKLVPYISECFVDHNSYLQGSHVGGIVCGVNGGIIVENCYFTGSISSIESKRIGGIIGDAWVSGCHVRNCFVASQTNTQFSGGTIFVDATEQVNRMGMVGNYCFSLKKRFAVNKLRLFDCYGQDNYNVMAKSESNPEGMDFENIWLMIEDGTPVLRAFHHTTLEGTHHDPDNIRTAEAYSCKNVNAPETTVVLQSGTEEIDYESLTGKIYSKIELPTPTREGYKFTGWYVYSDYQCLYDYGYFPPSDLTLYAGWEQVSLIQDFENYPNTRYDVDSDHWEYNRPGVRSGYKVNYTHGGSKSIHRLATEGEQDCLINYVDTLTEGQTYTMTFWVATDVADTSANLSLVHNTWPDYLEPNLGVEPMLTLTGLKVGEWTKYTYNFTAKTPWISVRTTGNASLYFDDFIIIATGTLIENKNEIINLGTGSNVNINTSTNASPNTGDSVAPIVALVATIVACAVVMLVSKRGRTEVIEK